MNINIQGYDELQKGLQGLVKYIGNPLSTFKFARIVMIKDVFDHFNKEQAPEGAWQPLKMIGMSKGGKITSYRIKKGKASSAKILQDTGRLRNSITGVATSQGAEVGTNLVYAPIHQFGSQKKNIPARTFIWLSEGAKETIVNQFIKDINNGIN